MCDKLSIAVYLDVVLNVFVLAVIYLVGIAAADYNNINKTETL